MTLFNRVNIACVEKFHEESIYDKIQWAEIRFFQGAHLYMLAWQHIEKKKTNEQQKQKSSNIEKKKTNKQQKQKSSKQLQSRQLNCI